MGAPIKVLSAIQIDNLAVEFCGTFWRAVGDGFVCVGASPMLAILDHDVCIQEQAIADAEQLIEGAEGRKKTAFEDARAIKSARNEIILDQARAML